MTARQKEIRQSAKTALEKRGINFDIGAPVTGSVTVKETIAVGFGDGTLRFFENDLNPRVVRPLKASSFAWLQMEIVYLQVEMMENS